jgi:hypothetical protein
MINAENMHDFIGLPAKCMQKHTFPARDFMKNVLFSFFP